MKTKSVEMILKRRFVKDKSLLEQTTPAEYAQICFETAIETYILSEQNSIHRTETDIEIEKRVRTIWQTVLDECGGDYEKAVKRCV